MYEIKTLSLNPPIFGKGGIEQPIHLMCTSSLSVCLTAYPLFPVSVCLSTCLSTCLSVSSTFRSVCLSVRSVCLSVRSF